MLIVAIRSNLLHYKYNNSLCPHVQLKRHFVDMTPVNSSKSKYLGILLLMKMNQITIMFVNIVLL